MIGDTPESPSLVDTADSAVGTAGVAAPRPGFVLLYARNFEQFSPAYVFDSPAIVIGRDATANVVISEQAVSRHHARISFDGHGWTLSDLGSRNGTMVDGAFIRNDVELEDSQEVRIGDVLFKFVANGADHYAKYRIDGTVRGERQAKRLTGMAGGWQMDSIAADLERIAPTPLSCVILGETGTGKEVAARELHRVSGRGGTFQAINCAAIPANLVESELFGYRRGAFSGADREKAGLVKLADGGTLFLDEIGDMPLEAQAKLLRVLQSHEVFPLGSTAPEYVDIRVVCATHRNLNWYVSEGKFRGDLFGRLCEHIVRIPALRERKEDIYQLARLFCARYGNRDFSFDFSFIVALFHHDWPFNVRELESCLKRATALAKSNVINVGELPESIAFLMRSYGGRPTQPHRSIEVDSPQRPFSAAARQSDAARRAPPTERELRDLLARHHGNVAAAGRELGKERMQVHRWMKRYGISIEDYRDER